MALGRRTRRDGGFAATLTAACDGEPEAITTLYRSVAPVVLGYLRSNRVANPEDVASEVFISVMGGLDRFQGDEDAFRSWVLTIAYRRRVDDARQQIRRPEDPGLFEDALGMSGASGAIGVGGVGGDVAEAAMDRLQAGGVIDAMSRLTEDQQTVLMLRILADLPIRDISRITGKGEAAVKALLRRGLASMARTLDAPDAMAVSDPEEFPARQDQTDGAGRLAT